MIKNVGDSAKFIIDLDKKIRDKRETGFDAFVFITGEEENLSKLPLKSEGRSGRIKGYSGRICSVVEEIMELAGCVALRHKDDPFVQWAYNSLKSTCKERGYSDG